MRTRGGLSDGVAPAIGAKWSLMARFTEEMNRGNVWNPSSNPGRGGCGWGCKGRRVLWEVVSGKFSAREPDQVTRLGIGSYWLFMWLGWPRRKVIIAALLRLD